MPIQTRSAAKRSSTAIEELQLPEKQQATNRPSTSANEGLLWCKQEPDEDQSPISPFEFGINESELQQLFSSDIVENQWGEDLTLGGIGEDEGAGQKELPSYLMAGALGSPEPHLEYRHDVDPEHPRQKAMSVSPVTDPRLNARQIKVEHDDNPIPVYSGAVDPDIRSIKANVTKGNDSRTTMSLRSRSGKGGKSSTSSSSTSRTQRTIRGRPVCQPRQNDFSPNRPLVERQKRHSDDDNESVSSHVSETPTDGTDGSDGSSNFNTGTSRRSSAGSRAQNQSSLPALPRIPSVAFSDQSKRQRRDVSMSAPAVAARELRLKKKQREEQLMTDCAKLKEEAEIMEKDTKCAKAQLEKLRQDAAYLRSLVKGQAWIVELLRYLQKAPFFGGNVAVSDGLRLDAGSILRQINGDQLNLADGLKTAKKNDDGIGGICLHINGAKVSLHLCSHCSSEASMR